MGLFHLQLQSMREEAKAETQDGSLKHRPQRDTAYWLTPRLEFISLSYQAQVQAPTPVSNQDCPLANLMEAVPQLRFPLARRVKLASENNHHS